MHSDYYNMVFGEKLANILYEANSQFFYEREMRQSRKVETIELLEHPC